MKFKDYIYLMLSLHEGKPGKALKIMRVRVKAKTDSDKNNEEVNNSYDPIALISRIVTIVTWFMVLASILSLGAIIGFAVFNKEAPSILSQLLLVMIGYLGGVIASYMRFMMPGKKTE
jgi:hypothetical protein